jgi:hypothetical protein
VASLLPHRNRSTDRLRRELLVAWVHLAVLWAFAFAKPLFDVLADAPEFFVARGNTRLDIVVLALGMILVPPTLLLLVEALAVGAPRVRRSLHLALVGGLVAAFVLQVFDDAFGGPSAVLLAAAAVTGAAAAFAYYSTRIVPSILTVLGPVPVIFVALFLFGSPVSKLVLPQESAQATDARTESRTPVVFVVFDEFDSNMLQDAKGRIDRTRYPNIAAFADHATWHRNATTVSDGTRYAVPAMLSGRRPHGDSLPIAADHPDNLFTLLAGTHQLEVIETATELCPQDLCEGRARQAFGQRIRSLTEDLGVVSLHLLLPEGLRSDLPAVDQTFGNFRRGGRDAPAGSVGSVGAAVALEGAPSSFFLNRRRALADLLEGIEETEASSVHFAHVALPHTPLQYLPTGQQYVAEDGLAGISEEVWGPDPAWARRGLQRHLLQVGYVDWVVGQLVAGMRRAGLYDDALIVLTADHGVSYRARLPRRDITRQTAGDIAGVPLFIRYPGQRRGEIDDSLVRNIDILPTIADRLRARIPWELDGQPIDGRTPRRSGVVGISLAGTDRVFRVSFEEFKRLHAAALRRMVRMFGSGDGGRGLYATQETVHLLGRPAWERADSGSAPARVELDNAELYADVQPAGSVIPSLVQGTITGDVRPGAPLVVAVNGRVRAVTDAVDDGDTIRLSAMVPPQGFRRGANRIDVLLMEGSPRSPDLVRLDIQQHAEYRLVEEDGHAVVVGGGYKAEIGKGRMNGYVEQLKLDDKLLQVSGWAFDDGKDRPLERLLVFDGTRLIAQAGPVERRPDVARKFATPTIVECGFQLSTSAIGVELADVRIIAVSGGSAAELPRG